MKACTQTFSINSGRTINPASVCRHFYTAHRPKPIKGKSGSKRDRAGAPVPQQDDDTVLPLNWDTYQLQNNNDVNKRVPIFDVAEAFWSHPHLDKVSNPPKRLNSPAQQELLKRSFKKVEYEPPRDGAAALLRLKTVLSEAACHTPMAFLALCNPIFQLGLRWLQPRLKPSPYARKTPGINQAGKQQPLLSRRVLVDYTMTRANASLAKVHAVVTVSRAVAELHRYPYSPSLPTVPDPYAGTAGSSGPVVPRDHRRFYRQGGEQVD